MPEKKRIKKISIEKEAILLIKFGLNLEGEILKFGLNEYKRELKYLEKKNKLSTKEFLKRFNSGELGDDEEWFDWLFAHKAYQHLKGKIQVYESIKI